MTLRLKGLGKRQIEKSWFHRGCIIYFHLHSQLGNKTRNKTCRVYSLPPSTIGTWLSKKCNISIWLPIVKSLQFENVIKSIPSTKISNSSFKNCNENVNKTNRMMCGLKKYDIKILTQTKICFGVSTNTHQSIRSNCFRTTDKSFLKKQTVRHNQRVIARPNKHLEVNEFVSKIVNDRWKMGIPITMDILKTKVLCHVKLHEQEPNYKLFSQVYNDEYSQKIAVFLKRSLEYCQFTNRSSSVSQKIPPNWKELSIAGACRVRKLFKEEDIDFFFTFS